jgi:saccharopine dehydrogenase-like NADP-dependent oxidoreductase
MNALVVGCGKVGSEIARDLASSNEISSVTALDAAKANLDRMRGIEKITRVKGSIGQRRVLKDLMEDADFVCGALPGRIGFELLERAVEAGKNIVDISYTPKNPIQLHRKALSNNCTVVPQCGVAPGLTNMCVGDASRRMDKIRTVRIFVGGLPQKPRPPLNYRVVFSLEDVINEYTRPVRVIENGKMRIVDPLSGRGFLSFPGVGKLEYFLTDGLGTLPDSFPGTRNMHELTLRYPGHVEIIDALRLLGFFGHKPIRMENLTLEPRSFSLEVLRQALATESAEDFLALRVEVEGILQGRRAQMSYRVLDWFDRKRQVSAMARTTAYPCTSVALLVARGMVMQKGVVPPEKIARDPKLFRSIVSRLRKHRVRLVTQLRRMSS